MSIKPFRFFRRDEALAYRDAAPNRALATADSNEKGAKMWLVFESRADMNKYCDSIPSAYRNFYELFEPNQPLFEVFDIDISNPALDQTPQSVFNQFGSAYAAFQEKINDKWHAPPDWRVLDSSQSGVKISLHIMNRSRAFQSPLHQKAWYDLCRANLEFEFDAAIMHDYRCLRMLGSCKMGSPRILKKALWHVTSRRAPDHEFLVTNVGEDVHIKHMKIPNVPRKPPKPVFDPLEYFKTIEQCDALEAKAEQTEVSHEFLKYIIECLPNDFCQHDIKNWINLIYICARYGFEDLAHKGAQLSNRYNRAATDRQYKMSVRKPIELSYKTLIKHVRDHLDDTKEYHRFLKNLPFNADTRDSARDYQARPPEPRAADVVINVERVDLTQYNAYGTLIVGSNLMTYKSQSIKPLIEASETTLVIVQRVQSAKDTKDSKYIESNFKAYYEEDNRDKGLLLSSQNPRLVVCINSIWRVRGQYDLVVLDEIESIGGMLTSFVSRPRECAAAFNSFVNAAKRVVACDATLTNVTCNVIRNLRPLVPSIIIDNQYQSMQGRECIIHVIPDDAFFLEKYDEALRAGARVVVPTNSIEAAKKANAVALSALNQDEARIGLYHQGRDKCVVEDWSNKDTVIYTPTITTGLSFNDKHFDKVIAYYTNMSAPAETSLQMLFRVRNTSCNVIEIFYKHSNVEMHELMLTEEDIKQYVVNKINHFDTSYAQRLDINPVSNKIKNDWYAAWYIHFMRLKNQSMAYHIPILRGLLEQHGVKTSVQIVKTKISEALAELKKETQACVKACNEAEAAKVIEAPQINEEKYMELNSKPQRTAAENYQVVRHNIENLVAPKTWSTKLVIELTRGDGFAMKAYRRCAHMRDYETRGELDMRINEGKGLVREQLNQYPDTNMAERMHAKLYYDKMGIIRDFIKAAGFKDCLDESKIEINYKELRRYVEDNSGALEMLWKKSKLKGAKNCDLMQYINPKLKSYGFKFARPSKSKKCKQYILKLNKNKLLKTHGIE